MQQASLPRRVDTRYHSVKEYLDVYCENPVNEVFFRKRTETGVDEHTYRQFRHDSFCMAQALINRGMTGKSIGLLAENRYEHCVCMFGSFMAGAVYVPLNPAEKGETLSAMLRFADCETIFVSRPLEGLAAGLKESCPELTWMISLDGEAPDGDSYFSLVREGENYKSDAFYGDFDDDRTAMRVYTSGTTAGKPKCVELTCKNLFTTARYQMHKQIDFLPETHDSVFYSPLPTFHLASFCIIVSYAIPLGGTYCTSNNPKDSFKDIVAYRPVFLHTVPAIAQVLLSFIEAAIEKAGETPWFADFCAACDRGEYSFKERREICKKYMGPVGGQLAAMTIAGAQADVDMVRKFEALGISSSCDYGMTESAPLITFDLQFYKHRGAVGRVMPYLSSKLEDGVLYVKGDSVMKGYYHNPEATEETLRDGWLCTGDLAEMDEEGYLYIKGRANSVAVLSNGENIDVDELTAKFTALPSVREIIIMADRKNNNDTLGALVYPAEGFTAQQVAADMAEANSELPMQKKVVRYRLTDKPFEKNGMMKIKRFMYLDEEI